MQISPYKSGDEKQILELFEICFKKKLPMDYWQWRFRENPTGKKMIMLMWDESKLVGHYAVSPVQMKMDQSTFLAGLSMTTMTHPDYTGKGIFQQLATELYEYHHKNDQMDLVWGFPNMNSHYGFIKNLAWKDISEIPTFSIGLGNIKQVDHQEISINNTITPENIAAIDECTNGYQLRVDKSAAYLEWRYFNIPDSPYTKFSVEKNGIEYFVIAKLFAAGPDKNSAEIDLVEIFIPNEIGLIEKIIQKIVYHFGKEKTVVQMNTWLPLSHPLHIQFEKTGFRSVLPITFMGARWMDKNKEGISVNNWHFSMGDSDIY